MRLTIDGTDHEIDADPDMPRVEVHILPSTRSPSGIGVPPVAPAIANAVSAATGRRGRVLPMAKGVA